MPKFKEYNQNQPMLLPPDIRDLIPAEHVCYTINNLVDQLDMSAIKESYSKLGASAYDPKMLTKLLFFAYMRGVRSSRRIEQLTMENLIYRYLSANQRVDHSTICLFRKKHLVELEQLFSQIVIIADKLKMVDITEIAIDGSIFTANASHKNTLDKESIKKIRKRIKKVLRQAERADKKENGKYEPGEGVYPKAAKGPEDKEARNREIAKLKNKLKELEEAEEIITEKQEKVKTENSDIGKQSRHNSHNTSDKDANLMKLKNGRTYKPAYNGQLATSNQLILAYDISDKGTDTEMLEPMIEKTEQITKTKIKTVKADAGYWSRDNIDRLNSRKIDAYIPDPDKAKEEKQTRDNTIPKFSRLNFQYDAKTDEFICPANKRLALRDESKQGKNIGLKRYVGQNCASCKWKDECTKSRKRTINYRPELEEQKIRMRKKLNSKKGKLKYQERMYDVEPVFGNIIYNQKAGNFLCRGKPMVKIEFGLSCIAHNLIKITNWIKEKNITISDLQLDTSMRSGANN